MSLVETWFAGTDMTWTELEAEDEILQGMLLPRFRRLVGERGYRVVDYVPALAESRFGNGEAEPWHDLDRLPAVEGEAGEIRPLLYVYRDPLGGATAAPAEEARERAMARIERGNYAAAIDPVGKHVRVQDFGVRDDLDVVRHYWERVTSVDYAVEMHGAEVDAGEVSYI